MEMETQSARELIMAIEEWAILDDEADVIGIKENAPEWARKAIEAELALAGSNEPVER